MSGYTPEAIPIRFKSVRVLYVARQVGNRDPRRHAYRYCEAALVDDSSVETEVGGVRSRVSTSLIDRVAVGDYLIVHAGFAIARLDVGEAEKTLALFEEMAARLGEPVDALYPRLP
jgi:hydrogenase expression/formation protein HypC